MARRRTRLQSSEVWMEMPREYSDHPLCKQLTTLKDEEALKDVVVMLGSSGRAERASGFLLSLLSPVWRAKLCGEFRQGKDQRLDLEEAEAEAVKMVIDLGCGFGGMSIKGGLTELVDLGQAAERYQVEEVRRAVEEEVVRHLSLETCGVLLMRCENSGLRRVEEACRKMALERFEDLTTTEGFICIGEEMLRSLLEDERLECQREDKMFEGVVKWMKRGEGGELRGEDLLETIRCPLMDGYYLMTSARNALEGSERLERLVMEALGLKSVPTCEWEKNVKWLGGQALRGRVLQRIRWEEYGEGRRDALRLAACSNFIFSLAERGEWVCGGLGDGQISVWNKASLAVERTLTGHASAVCALVVWEGWLVSGAKRDHDLRVWDVRGGQCVRTLVGHTNGVLALAVSSGVLLSGSKDKTIRVWRLEGLPSAWTCERTMTGHMQDVWSLAWWGGKGVSGCASGAIRVWDLSTGECVRTLQGHTRHVKALVVIEGRLLSASYDGNLREWCLESGKCVKVVRVCPSEPGQYIRCLVTSGQKLVGGSISPAYNALAEYEVVVWELETLAEEWRLKQPAGQRVHSLLAIGGEVWGGVGRQAALWGRKC